jgi:hypothetical protein
MNKDINRYQANTLADLLLFLVVATGLLAMIVNWPVARTCGNNITREHHLKRSFPNSIKFGVQNTVHSNFTQ